MTKILFLLFLFLLMSSQVLLAEDKENVTELGDEDLLLLLEEGNEGHHIYKFPAIAPNIFLQAGVKLFDQDNADQVFEYEFLKDSPWFQGLIHSFSYPHRQYLHFDFNNEKDHFADLRYAYSDMFLLRWNNTAVFHNLGNSSLVPLAPGGYSIAINDPNAEYGVKNERNNIFLRLKTHDFPFHFYLAGEQNSRNGTMQQRSALGGAYYGNIAITSQARDVDWLTEIYTVGANSHLGPVEVDILHKEKRFAAKRDQFLVDTYSSAGGRTGGDYPHNLLPDLSGFINSMKIHSAYTGRVVASATFSHNARDNKTSGADSDAYTGAGAIQWIPRNNLSLNLRYSHHDLSVNNPSRVDMTSLSDPDYSITYFPKSSISSVKERISLTSRYKPLKDLTLRARYDFAEKKRTNPDLWLLRESTRYNSAVIAVRKKFDTNLTGDLQYRFKHIDNPSYNVEPDNAHEGEAKLSWLPHTRVNLLFDYKISRTKRDGLHFIDTTDPQNRQVLMDNFFILGTITLRDDLLLTVSHSFIRHKIEQDLEYHSSIGEPIIDPGVTYRDDGRIYSAALHFSPLDSLQFGGEVTHIRSSGGFDPNQIDFLNPSIGSYSRQDIQETFYRLTGEYRFANGLALGLEYAYAYFDDVLDNIYDGEVNGKGHIVMLSLSKQW